MNSQLVPKFHTTHLHCPAPPLPFDFAFNPNSTFRCFEQKTGSLLARAREQGLENLNPILQKTKKTTKMKEMMSPKPEDFAVTSTPKN
jgi:hypothetical protein